MRRGLVLLVALVGAALVLAGPVAAQGCITYDQSGYNPEWPYTMVITFTENSLIYSYNGCAVYAHPICGTTWQLFAYPPGYTATCSGTAEADKTLSTCPDNSVVVCAPGYGPTPTPTAAPTATPTPSASPTPTPTPVAAQVAPGAERSIEISALGGLCTEGVLTCSGADVSVYVNGLWVGTCAEVGFYPRGLYSDTITLVNTGETTQTITVSTGCGSMFSFDAPLPTPTPYIMHPVSGSYAPMPGFLGLEFGGDVNNPNAPVNEYLDRAEDVISLVNRGNLLYIVGGVLVAAMLLSWAIEQVKNPKL